MRKNKILMWGWLVDPILNSLNSHYNKCMADSKEKYKFDPGVKGLIAFTLKIQIEGQVNLVLSRIELVMK